MTSARRFVPVLVVSLLAVAYSTHDAPSDHKPTDDDTPTDASEVVEFSASDELAGRDNSTEGSRLAQDDLISQLQEFAQPLPGGVDALASGECDGFLDPP